MSQSNTDNNQIILGYWKIRGLVEPSRLVLHYTKTPYTEKMYEQGEGPEYSREEWFSEKQKLGLDFPNLPYLFNGDLKITQSKAILYYLGRKLNLMGKNLNEEANVMMLCEEAHDLRLKLSDLHYSPKEDSKEETKKFAETTLSEYLKKFDDYLGKQNTKFAVGDQPTVADFQLYEYIDSSLLFEGGQALLEKYSNLKQFLKTIRELPEIKDYIAKAHTQLPINNKASNEPPLIIKNKCRSREAKARRNKRRRDKRTEKQKQLYITRSIESSWTIKHVKDFLHKQKIKFAKLPPIRKNRLRIQFNNPNDLALAEKNLPKDTFSQEIFSQWFPS